ncbi:MAG: TIGR01459 family HAD-type hydrolase [Alphaproteobacteria bacterium]
MRGLRMNSGTAIRVIGGLAELAGDYDLFIFDLWGVVHNGVAVYPGAVDCLSRLRRRGSRVVLLSNAPRPSASVAGHLEELGIGPALYDWLLTSGEATANAIAATVPRPAYFHLGPERNRPTLDACGGREVDLAAAELILCTGLFDDEVDRAEDYRDLLSGAVSRNLTMICANPDLVVIRGEEMIQCAGAVAAFYEELGGQVRRFGKPFPEIFDRLFAASPEIPKSRAVMVGDALATDIRGARRAGIDAVWIVGGIHGDDMGLGPDGQFDEERMRKLAEEAGERPQAALSSLHW